MWITVDKNKNISLSRQIYTQIKQLILEGNLMEYDKLPSSRDLSKELYVSRNTILEAYNQLIAEGYLQGNPGSGTIVANGIARYKMPSSDTKSILSIREKPNQNKIIDFRSGIPDLTLFPKKKLGKLYQYTCINLSEKAFRYHSSAGVSILRYAITDYLFRTRGLCCNPNNLMIVSGATQGLSLISRLLCAKGKKVLIENPTHPGLKNVIAKVGFQVKGIDADDYGLDTRLLKPSKDIAFIYTTPSHQYPLGSILPIKRRLDLIQYALTNNCYIIEDDYDSEFHYEGQPVNSLCELNPDKVIYSGTFSKILSPSIRLGYLILPDELVSPYLELKQYSDVHTESLSQYVLAEFIQNGGLEKHIWKMKKVYAKKRQHLIDELNRHFLGEFEIRGHAAGLHIIARFYNVVFTEELVKKLYKNNVKIYPLENYNFLNTANYENQVLLGYGHLDLAEISEGIRLLSQSLKSALPSIG